jgi:uncharacterized protein YecE (DUF72 family)
VRGWIFPILGALYGGNYPREVLMAQATQIDRYLAAGLDVFAYFNNDLHGYAVQNAADLRRYIETSASK